MNTTFEIGKSYKAEVNFNGMNTIDSTIFTCSKIENGKATFTYFAQGKQRKKTGAIKSVYYADAVTLRDICAVPLLVCAIHEVA